MAQRQWRSDDTDKWVYGFGDGSDGDVTISSNTTEAPIDASCSGTASSTSLSATNVSFAAGQLLLIHQTRGTGAGNWELNKIESYTAGTITLKHALINTYTDSGASQAQVRVLKQYNNVTVNTGVTWTAKAWNGDVGGILGFFAKGTVTVTGTISASEKGYVGGIGRINAGTGFAGEGTAGASVQQTTKNGNGGGGGTTAYGSGGGGGHASAGGAGSGAGAAEGGASAGTASLVTCVPGGGGGGNCNTSTAAQTGGTGGGITFIFADTITITGTIVHRGGDGPGATPGTSAAPAAGGACLIKCKTATLGTNLITALPGTAQASNFYGGAGSNGRIHIDYKTSYSGTTNPTIDATQDGTIDYPLAGGAFLYHFI